MKRFEDYKQEVILAYKKKRNEGSLSPNLQHPKPANIKTEILDIFSERHSEKDDVTFTFFLGKQTTAGEHFKMLEDAKLSVFKPLQNFLIKDADSGTHDRNIYLLAWLIDFKPRPYRSADIYELVKNDRASSESTTSTAIEESEEQKNETGNNTTEKTECIGSSFTTSNLDNTKSTITEEPIENPPSESTDDLSITNQDFGVPRKFNRTIVAFFAALVIICGTYIFYNAADHQCMYWDGNQYKEIPCDQKVDGTTIIALDTFRLARLKKITDLKLITPNGFGKIHYSKMYGKVEFYTTGGENPTDHRKRLLPMTEFIYRKYVLKLAD